MRFLFCFVLAIFFFLPPSWGQDTSSELKQVQKELEKQQQQKTEAAKKAKKLSEEVLATKKKIVGAARKVQEYESSLNQLESQMEDLEEEQDILKAKLDVKNRQLQKVLAGLQILAQRPTEALFVLPLSPQDTLRSALMLKGTVPAIEESAAELKKELILLSSLKAAIRAKRSQIKMAYVGLEEKNKQLTDLMKEKSSLQSRLMRQSEQAGKKARQLAGRAQDLVELLAKLEAERKRQEEEQRALKSITPQEQTPETVLATLKAFERSKGTLPFPVTGRISSKFGETVSSGLHSKGLTFTTRKGAQVISPYDGTVLFAGPFKGYGNLVIIEHAEGYHTLLSGIARMDVAEGQMLLAGEPVGTMGIKTSPELYMEMRKNGSPINPLPWLAFKA
ncbi:MAG: peptidoglycan DD-metalloendopeptidase family protein [Alphaproteobacteria bacterium]|nr:peptidoglycan DD-metalloendopeptidase family protein [Alphaproteobacteria bacterium]